MPKNRLPPMLTSRPMLGAYHHCSAVAAASTWHHKGAGVVSCWIAPSGRQRKTWRQIVTHRIRGTSLVMQRAANVHCSQYAAVMAATWRWGARGPASEFLLSSKRNLVLQPL
jgi:hypothetical protein